jgi:hypothetical protein
MPTDAPKILTDLLKDGFKPETLDQVHDTLKLLGVVLGQMALLEIATDPAAETAPRVSAARALMKIDESPEAISERLKKSALAGLTVAQLGLIIDNIKNGDTDVAGMIKKLNTQ